MENVGMNRWNAQFSSTLSPISVDLKEKRIITRISWRGSAEGPCFWISVKPVICLETQLCLLEGTNWKERRENRSFVRGEKWTSFNETYFYLHCVCRFLIASFLIIVLSLMEIWWKGLTWQQRVCFPVLLWHFSLTSWKKKKGNSWKMSGNPRFCWNDSRRYFSGSPAEFSVLAHAREKAFSRVAAHLTSFNCAQEQVKKKNIYKEQMLRNLFKNTSAESWPMSLFQHECTHFSLLRMWFMFHKHAFVYRGQMNLASRVSRKAWFASVRSSIEMQRARGGERRRAVGEME